MSKRKAIRFNELEAINESAALKHRLWSVYIDLCKWNEKYTKTLEPFALANDNMNLQILIAAALKCTGIPL